MYTHAGKLHSVPWHHSDRWVHQVPDQVTNAKEQCQGSEGETGPFVSLESKAKAELGSPGIWGFAFFFFSPSLVYFFKGPRSKILQELLTSTNSLRAYQQIEA